MSLIIVKIHQIDMTCKIKQYADIQQPKGHLKFEILLPTYITSAQSVFMFK